MPRRNAITISLPDDLLAALDTMVGAAGGRSAAVQALLRDAGPNPQVSAPAAAPAAGLPERAIVVSEAGHAVLSRFAEEAGLTVDEVARLALRYAATFPARWLPPAETL